MQEIAPVGGVYETSVVKYRLQLPLQIFFLGDLHIGAYGSNYEAALAKLEKLMDERTYLAFLGDLVDMATRNSVANVYEQRLNPQQQLSIAYDLINRYRAKILGIVQGNHDYRVVKEIGFDPIMEVCRMLNVPYSRSFMIIDLEFNEKKYVIAMHHGIAGGRQKTASVRQGELFERFITFGVDLYVTGHTHKPAVVPFKHAAYDRNSGRICEQDGFLLTIPSMLQNELYGLQRMFEPSATLYPIVILRETEQGNIGVDIRWVDIG